MRIVMLAPRATVQGPLPKHTPLLVAALRRLGCEVELLPWGRRVEGERLLAKLLGRARDVADARRAPFVPAHDPPALAPRTEFDSSNTIGCAAKRVTRIVSRRPSSTLTSWPSSIWCSNGSATALSDSSSSCTWG
jgi:hypothetical protein